MSPTKKSSAAPVDKAINRPCPSSLAPGDASPATSGPVNSGGKSGSPKKDKTSIIASNSAKITQDKVFKRDPADKSKIKPDLSPKKYSSNNGNTTDEEYVNISGTTGGDTIKTEHGGDEHSDEDFMDCGSDADDCGHPSAGKKPLSSPKKPKKSGPPDPNGRVVGRKLVMWHRPRMVEKLVMHTQFECHRAGLKIPWDKIVERLSPGSSGFAALQHLNKLRDILVTEGHMVPPLLGKKSVPQDPTVRGYIRDMDAEKPTDTRVVRWGEKIEDRKESLVVEGVVRGSGNYRRGIAKAIEKTIKASGIRRNRLPSELQDARKSTEAEMGTKGKDKKTKNPSKKGKRSASDSASSASADPAELDSDDEYDPAAKKKGKYGLRKAPKRTNKSFDDFSDDGAVADIDESTRTAVVAQTPPRNRLQASVGGFNHGEARGLVTPPSTLPVKLLLRPEILARFPAGSSFIKKEMIVDGDAPTAEEFVSDVEEDDDEVQQDYENGTDDDGEYDEDPEDYANYLSSQQPLAPIDPRVKEYLVSRSYQGIETHGTLAQYRQALHNGDDPRINGIKYKLLLAQQTEKAGSQSKGLAHQRKGMNMADGDVYTLAPPPAYNSYPVTLGHCNGPLAGTSAAAFAASSGVVLATSTALGSSNYPAASESHNVMNFDSNGQTSVYNSEVYDQLSNSYPAHGNRQQMIEDIIFSGNDGLYTTGSDIFQTGSNFFQSGSNSSQIGSNSLQAGSNSLQVGSNSLQAGSNSLQTGSNHIKAGSDFFQVGSNSFNTSNMIYENSGTGNVARSGMASDLGEDDDLNANFSSVTVASSHSNDFEVATDHTATDPSNNLDLFHGSSSISETWSSADYAQYLDDDENKENEDDWFRY